MQCIFYPIGGSIGPCRLISVDHLLEKLFYLCHSLMGDKKTITHISYYAEAKVTLPPFILFSNKIIYKDKQEKRSLENDFQNNFKA